MASRPSEGPMSDSLLGEMGAGSAPERSTSSSCLASCSCFSWSPAPIVMVALPPPIFVLMTGAESTMSSRMIAKRRLTFAPVTSSKRSDPAGEDLVAPEVFLFLVRRGVGDVVAGELRARVHVNRAPADVLELQRIRVGNG